MFPDSEQSDRLRGLIMDWLPHSAMMITSTAPEMGAAARGPASLLPFHDFKGALAQLPSQPFAILKPILEITTGQTAFGQDVKATGPADEMGRIFAGILGFMAPPLIQKYGLRTTTPDISASEWLTGEPVFGDPTNVSRFLIDTGFKRDPSSSFPNGSITNEAFLKNFSLWKSWATDPAHEMTNAYMAETYLSESRTVMSKNLSFYLINGMDSDAQRILLQVMGSFAKQHIDDPRRAQDEYGKWLQRQSKSIGKHPRLRGWNRKEIESKLREASNFSAAERGKARDQMIDFLRGQVSVDRIKRIQALSKEKETKTGYEKWEERTGKLTKNPSLF